MDYSSKKQHYYTLDLIRFFAALAVVCFHLGFRCWNLELKEYTAYPELAFFKYGYLGVDVFFMVSGFVILLTASNSGAISFLISRISRLFPAYWICVTITFIFAIYFPIHDYKLGFSDYLVNLTMHQGFFGYQNIDGSYWTLQIELQFYFMILIILFLNSIKYISNILGIWLVVLLFMDVYGAPGILKSIAIYPWGHYFISGAVFHMIHKKGVTVYSLVLIFACYVRSIRLGNWYMHLKEDLSGFNYDEVVVIVLISFFYLLFFMFSLNKLNLKSKKIRIFGNVTYPLYLIHGTIGIALLEKYHSATNGYYLLIILILTAVFFSHFMHEMIEKKSIKLLKFKLYKIFEGKKNLKIY